MFKTNVGRLDRALRVMAGAVLALTGLFVLGGWQGKLAGIGLALFALWPLMTGLFGFCGTYRFLGISTVEKGRCASRADAGIDPIPTSRNTDHGMSELPDGAGLGETAHGGRNACCR